MSSRQHRPTDLRYYHLTPPHPGWSNIAAIKPLSKGGSTRGNPDRRFPTSRQSRHRHRTDQKLAAPAEPSEPGVGVGRHSRWRLVHRRGDLLLGVFPELDHRRSRRTHGAASNGLLRQDETRGDETGRDDGTRWPYETGRDDA